MTADAATLAIVGVFALGLYGARWRGAERDLQSAKARLQAAGKAAWQTRRVIVAVGIFTLILIDMWFRGKGR